MRSSSRQPPIGRTGTISGGMIAYHQPADPGRGRDPSGCMGAVQRSASVDRYRQLKQKTTVAKALPDLQSALSVYETKLDEMMKTADQLKLQITKWQTGLAEWKAWVTQAKQIPSAPARQSQPQKRSMRQPEDAENDRFASNRNQREARRYHLAEATRILNGEMSSLRSSSSSDEEEDRRHTTTGEESLFGRSSGDVRPPPEGRGFERRAADNRIDRYEKDSDEFDFCPSRLEGAAARLEGPGRLEGRRETAPKEREVASDRQGGTKEHVDGDVWVPRGGTGSTRTDGSNLSQRAPAQKRAAVPKLGLAGAVGRGSWLGGDPTQGDTYDA